MESLPLDQSSIDEAGEAILESISNANRFNHWMFKTIEPWCQGKILEIGSGIGNISSLFLDYDYEIQLTDLRGNYCRSLEKKFVDYPNLLGISTMNMIDPAFDENHSEFFDRFDTVFALNVVEHIENDQLALLNAKKLLKEKGRIIILVPAHQYLYNHLDEELGHFKRYSKKGLRQLIQMTGFSVLHQQYFNFPGIVAWWIGSFNKNKKTITESQMKLYNTFVPIFKVMDRLTLNSYGLSLVIVAEKNI